MNDEEQNILADILGLMDRVEIKGRAEVAAYMVCVNYLQDKMKILDAPLAAKEPKK